MDLTHPPLHCSTATIGTLPPPQWLTSIPITNTTMVSGRAAFSGQQPATLPQSMGMLDPPGETLPTSSGGLILSPAAAPFPCKLVEKVRSGQFIEMCELLVDNISLLQQLETIQGTNPINMLGPSRPRLREVSSLST